MGKTITVLVAVAVLGGCQYAPGPQQAMLMREQRLALEQQRAAADVLMEQCRQGSVQACAFVAGDGRR